MKRSEILQIARPILFNTAMVRAIMDGRKTVTRRAIKINFKDGEAGYKIVRNTHTGEFCYLEVYDEWESEVRRIGRPYIPGDYMYVPEAWKCTAIYKIQGRYGYEVEYKDGSEYYFEFLNKERSKKYEKYLDKPEHQWQSPYFMPKEAARIFLRVTDVRVERLKDMTADSAMNEGFTDWNDVVRVWDSTISPKDRDKYGWAANPWVWVIEFEMVEEIIANTGKGLTQNDQDTM